MLKQIKWYHQIEVNIVEVFSHRVIHYSIFLIVGIIYQLKIQHLMQVLRDIFPKRMNALMVSLK